jgi:glucokinase
VSQVASLDCPTVYACGIDIGGTKIAAGLVSEQGELVERLEVPTLANDVGAIIDSVVALLDQLGSDAVEPVVGVAAAAFLNRERSKVFFAPNIAWTDFPLKDALEQRLGRHVRLENDANAAGWAEYQFGAARDAASMLMLTMGTGVGGAIVDDGRLVVGGYGAAGELGHIIVHPGGRACGCGNKGCLEQYASGTALMRDARERLGTADLTPQDMTELLSAGDSTALSVLDGVCEAMGLGITSLVAVTDPEVVVIGGGVATGGAIVTDRITEAFQKHYGAYERRPVPAIVVATMGNTAGVIGAADLARRHTHSGA